MPSEKGSGGDCHHKAVSTNRAYDAVLLDDLGVLSATVDGSLLPCVAQLREHGLLTAVLSNADGPPRSGLEGLGPGAGQAGRERSGQWSWWAPSDGA